MPWTLIVSWIRHISSYFFLSYLAFSQKDGDTAFLAACAGGHWDVVRWLQRKKASVSVPNGYVRPPSYLRRSLPPFCCFSHPTFLQDDPNPLRRAELDGCADIVKKLKEAKFDESHEFPYDDDPSDTSIDCSLSNVTSTDEDNSSSAGDVDWRQWMEEDDDEEPPVPMEANTSPPPPALTSVPAPAPAPVASPPTVERFSLWSRTTTRAWLRDIGFGGYERALAPLSVRPGHPGDAHRRGPEVAAHEEAAPPRAAPPHPNGGGRRAGRRGGVRHLVSRHAAVVQRWTLQPNKMMRHLSSSCNQHQSNIRASRETTACSST